ncbi:MAG: hypothetical protein K6F53_02190 [Lachnospiraceae bacterium]|nr:hypothetical protein [Lachnospiraceae bacterium]
MSKQEDYEEETYTAEPSEDYEDPEAYELERRAFRHRRRVRNQIIAIIVAVVLVVALAAGCVIGIGRLANVLNKVKAETTAETATDQNEASGGGEDQVTIEAPMETEE